MRQRIHALLAAAGMLALVGFSQIATAAEYPYTEGPVSTITSIRTVDGMFDDYMAWLDGEWKKLMEAQKAAGIILGYHVYLAFPRSPNEPDLYLQVTYKNMAALDNLNQKLDPISEKVIGPMQKANAEQVARAKMRTVLGDEMIREMNLK